MYIRLTRDGEHVARELDYTKRNYIYICMCIHINISVYIYTHVYMYIYYRVGGGDGEDVARELGHLYIYTYINK